MSSYGMKAWLVASLFVMLAACGRTPPPSAELRIDTVDLREGQQLGAGRDVDPATPGFQLDIAIRVTDVNGVAVPLGAATLEWREEPDTLFKEKKDGQLDGEKATFAGLTLPASDIFLRIEVAEKDGPRTMTLIRRVRLSFDDSKPVVTGWSLPADANADGILNIAELAAGPVVLHVDAVGMAGGTAKVLARDTDVELGSVEVTGEEVAVTLEHLDATGEKDVDFRIVLTNALGNSNDASDVNGYGRFAVDAVAPNLTLLSPTASVLGLADDADGAAGHQVLVRARTSADVGADGFSFTLTVGGAEGATQTATPTENEAGVFFTLDEGAEHAVTVTALATDLAGNPSAARVHEVLVDLAPPVIASVGSPVMGGTYADTELSVEAAVSGADGRSLEVFRRQGSARTSVGAIPVTAGVAQGTLSFVPGTFDVVLEVADAAGNRSQTEVTGVTVNSAGCAIQITSPATRPMLYGIASDLDAGTAGLQTTVEGTTPECAGQTVNFSRSGGAIEATVTAGVDGSFSFPVTLAHGETTRLAVAVANIHSVISSDFVDVNVDLVAPSVDGVSPDATSFAFVAETNVNLGTAGYFVDEVAGGDAQATLQVTATGEIGDTVFGVYEGVVVSAVHTLTSATQTFDVAIELPHGVDGTLEFVAEDAAGNRGVLGRASVVDVVAPATPSVTANIVETRRATVDVSWTASGDDGTSGAVAGYDFRYSTNAVLEFGIETEAQFFTSDGTEPLTKRVGTGLIPAGTVSHTLTLPPFAQYSFQVRAVDEVGNYSVFQVTPTIDNGGAYVVLSNPGSGNRFGIRVSTGDFDGDGHTDLAVGDDSVNAVYVYGGGPGFGSAGVTTTLTPIDGVAGYFGTSPSAGNLDGDTMADDLIVGSSTWSGNRGRAFLYFGQVGLGIGATNAIELRGEVGTAGFFGSHISLIPDLNGDGIDEFAIDASGVGTGRVYLFFGRPKVDWQAAASATDDGGTTFYIPAESADRIFVGPVPPAGSLSSNTLFGRNAVIETVGDLDGDGVAELAVAATRTNVNSVYIFGGAFVLARDGSGAGGSTTILSSEAQFALNADVVSGERNLGFGFQMVGRIDANGDGRADLVVSNPRSSQVYLFEGQADGTLNQGAVIEASEVGASFFGNAVASGDLNGDGWVDLLVGPNPAAGTASTWALYHSGDGVAPYDVRLPGFNVARHRGLTITRGLAVGIADLTGDGLSDVVSTDRLDGNGKIYVRY